MAKKEKELSVIEKLERTLIPDEEQPYEVPKNWCWTTIEHICDLKSGTTYPVENELESGERKYIKIADMNLEENQREITTSSRYLDKYKLEHLIPVPSLIFPKRGGAILTNKKRLVLEDEILVDLNTMAMVPKNKVMIMYLYYWFLTIDLGELNNGSTVPQINNKDINPLKIPLPPLAEQRRIVEQIENLFNKLDEAKDLIDDVIKLHYLRKASIYKRALNGELTSKCREKSKIKLDSWNECKLVDLCTKITDGTHNSPKNYESGQYMYITAKNIKEKGVDLSNLTYVSEEDHNEIYSRCNVKFGDVLYIKDGATTGIATINNIKEPFSLLSSVALLKPDTNVLNAKFLVYKLNSPETKSMMINNMSGNAITRLTISKIKETKIYCPPIEEQEKIVEILDTYVNKEQSALELIDLSDNINLIKKSILAKAFRSELSTTDLSEPSSIEILKEILSEK